MRNDKGFDPERMMRELEDAPSLHPDPMSVDFDDDVEMENAFMDLQAGGAMSVDEPFNIVDSGFADEAVSINDDGGHFDLDLAPKLDFEPVDDVLDHADEENDADEDWGGSDMIHLDGALLEDEDAGAAVLQMGRDPSGGLGAKMGAKMAGLGSKSEKKPKPPKMPKEGKKAKKAKGPSFKKKGDDDIIDVSDANMIGVDFVILQDNGQKSRMAKGVLKYGLMCAIFLFGIFLTYFLMSYRLVPESIKGTEQSLFGLSVISKDYQMPLDELMENDIILLSNTPDWCPVVYNYRLMRYQAHNGSIVFASNSDGLNERIEEREITYILRGAPKHVG